MSFTQDILKNLKERIADLEKFPEDIEKNDKIKQSLLEIQVQLTDCIVDINDNFEIVDACYKYNEEEKKPQYIISMTKLMEDRLLERVKDNPAFKVDNELIAEDKNYPDTFRNHVAGILSTLIFNFINEDGVDKAEKKLDKSMKLMDHMMDKIQQPPTCPEYKLSESDFSSVISNKDLDPKIYNQDINPSPILGIQDKSPIYINDKIGINDFAAVQT